MARPQRSGGQREPRRPASDEPLLAAAEAEARVADVCILVVGTHGFWEMEGVDQPHLRLLGRQDELVARVGAAARGPVVVVLNVGSPKHLPWLGCVDAVLLAHFGGQEAASAVTSVLLGEVNPSGRLPTTWPRSLSDVPAKAAAARREGLPRPGDVPYDEGLWVGHRGLSPSVSPYFHFGHGLSYTRFVSSPLEARQTKRCSELGGPHVEVRLVVKNMGERAGSQIVQIYTEVLSGHSATHLAPRSLRGFQRTAELGPGCEQHVQINLGPRGLGAWYDITSSSWQRPAPGWCIRIAVADSAAVDQVLSRADLVLE